MGALAAASTEPVAARLHFGWAVNLKGGGQKHLWLGQAPALIVPASDGAASTVEVRLLGPHAHLDEVYR